jgi:hypothetical protein
MNKKMIGLVSAVLMIVGAFLPWVNTEVMGMSESTSGFMGSGKGAPGALTVIFGVLCAIFIFLDKKWSNIAAMVLAILSIAWVLERFATIKEKIGAIPNLGMFSVKVSMGLGLYLIIAAGVGVIIGAVMSMRSNKPTA